MADNVTNHNALLRRLSENGNISTVTGRQIVRELEYASNGTVGFYSGYETLDVSPSDVLTSATFDYKQMAGNVTNFWFRADTKLWNRSRYQFVRVKNWCT